ncbi:MAG: aminopeptidase N, partial [Gammaproteobacteria bacterium]|nr:aminopeptidase N [Gammaproteobacteria bacterium]
MKKELTKYLRDYKRPDYLIPKVDLHFDIRVNFTVVTSTLHIKRNGRHKRPLVLNGEDLELLSVRIDGDLLKKSDYHLTDEELCINVLVDEFCLETRVRIKPHKNTRLEGLYKSNGNYFTQCEPHGFRRITYFLDRPDIMSEFTTKISVPASFKAVLSNGNVVQSVHKNKCVSVLWHDPSLKPCYLFALVVGNFDIERTVFVTKSGREVDVRVYVEQGQKKRALYALESLVRAMHWDEDIFNREYDLDRYMIVAVSDFNVGAMENKGLNIFNSKYVLVDSKIATDDDYINVASVVGHEYFHNWSGNRVTCRDWFQLSLKEGLTVFRDQEFTADITNPVVKRIGDVNIIRTLQFAEDAGPMAHPVQPRSYVEMNNFYTVTVYDKGAEIVRMLQTILGNKHFHDAMSLYFNNYDGKAITINEFIAAMSVTSGIDLTQFKKWYRYAGTPRLTITDSYDERCKRYVLTVRQDKNFHIPLAIGL